MNITYDKYLKYKYKYFSLKKKLQQSNIIEDKDEMYTIRKR